jgi:hypothetical protein
VKSTIVDETPLKYVRASLHTPVEVFVAVADTVFETEKLTEGDLVLVTDEDAALDPVTDAVSDRESEDERDSDLEPVIEAEVDLEPEDETDVVLEVVASIDSLADSLLLILLLADSLLLILVLAVSDAVKLGETGDAVTEGVGVGDGIMTVYDMKKTEPEPRLIIFAPI